MVNGGKVVPARRQEGLAGVVDIGCGGRNARRKSSGGPRKSRGGQVYR